jgi:hypothetical protein
LDGRVIALVRGPEERRGDEKEPVVEPSVMEMMEIAKMTETVMMKAGSAASPSRRVRSCCGS